MIDITLDNIKWITSHDSATTNLPTRTTCLAFYLIFGLGALELAYLAFHSFLLAVLLSKSTLIASRGSD